MPPAVVFCGTTFSSIKTSLIRLLMTCAPTGAYDLDQRTTPEVVKISKASNIVNPVNVNAKEKTNKTLNARKKTRSDLVAERGEVGARKRIGSSATYKHPLSIILLSSAPAFPVTRSLPRHQIFSSFFYLGALCIGVRSLPHPRNRPPFITQSHNMSRQSL
jgi:hypothetical protein